MYDGGYWGKILRVDLTSKKATEEKLPLEIARDFIGGAGFGIKYLFNEVKAGTDPLGSENKLIFSIGPFTGTSIPCTSRMAVIAKSPLTNAVGVALTGGYFPVELKNAGYDAVIIEGKAEKPTYLWIKNGAVDFRDAGKVWGTQTSDCQHLIKDDLNDQSVRVACIGPAGENLSKLACIINERRAAGRRGLGAVMGSKNLKAIAVKGTGSVAVSSEEKFKAARKIMTKAMKDSPILYPAFSNTGSPMGVNFVSFLGIYPAKNWTATGEFAPVEQLGIEAQKTRKVGRTHCHGCPVGCSQLNLARTGTYIGTFTEGPEYETFYAYGGQTGVDNIDSIIAADRMSDELGLDTISAGVTIGFAMELFEKGILTVKDTEGLDLEFGNHEAMIELIRMMAFRKGIGDLLSDGVKAAAEKLGRGTDKYALHVKGLELPGYDVRGAMAHGLSYATCYAGADHNKGYAFQEIFGAHYPHPVDRFSTKDKGKLTVWNQDMQTAVTDCPTLCAFIIPTALLPIALQNTADLMGAVTGLSYTDAEVLKVGERVNNLARAFNVREGFGRKDDTLPERLMTEPLQKGASKGRVFSKDDLNLMLDEYYTIRGWELASGIPTKEKLIELGLESAAEQIHK